MGRAGIILTLVSFLTAGLVITSCATNPESSPAPQTDNQLVMELAGERQAFLTDRQGRVKSKIEAASADGAIRLSLAANTIVRDRGGEPLRTIQASPEPAPPPPPEDTYLVGTAYTLRPEDATFQPWLLLTLSYDLPELPAGITPNHLYIAYHNGAEWRPLPYRRVDFTARQVTTQVDHATTFAIMGGKSLVPPGYPTPAVGIMLGNLAPEFKLPSLDGPSFSLSGLRGKPVMLNFWATWCDACRFEMPLLQQVQEKWSERGLVLLAIDIGETPEQVRNFMQSQRLSLTVLLDSQGEVANRYGIRYLPTTFFINGDGIIKEIRIGAFPSTSAIENSLRKIMP